jgi:hypothetical protein
LSAKGGFPALLKRTGDIGKSLTLRRVAYPFFAALLGCVKWPIKHFITVNNAKTPFGSSFNTPLLGVVVKLVHSDFPW